MSGGPYNNGTPINLVERFWLIDPITELATLADPTTVTFAVEAPDGTLTSYVFGIDPNVTRSSVGIYVCKIGPLPSGTYVYRAVGTGAVIAESAEKSFLVYESSIAPGDDIIPTPGPLEPWIDGSDVVSCGPDLGVGSDTWKLDDVAASASTIMFELLGRKFNGIVTAKVRPCTDACGCWGGSSGLAVWSWTANWVGGGYGGWSWRDQTGASCGCDPLSRVRLGGWPVREVLQVKIDGQVLTPLDTNGNPNYRLDRHRELVRMDDPSGGVSKRFWPGCQNLALDDSQTGTFSVSYKWGQEAPGVAQAAAAQLARELWKACTSDKCNLPTRVTRVVRQGVTMERIVPIADLLRGGSTGLPLVDIAIATFNPTKQRRSTAVWSPDMQRYARPEGRYF